MKKYISTFIISITILAGYFGYQNFGYQVEAFIPRKFPALENPKNIALNCNYKGSELQIEETLYGSVYDFYKSEPKKKKYFYSDDNKSFVFNYEEDKTLDQITEKISALGDSKGLNEDQKLDLASCFLQDIPYDEVKAKKILDPNFSKYPVNEIIPRFPYETLYENTGICTDKSYLGAAIYKRLGYGVSLLSFDTERHLSVGVAVPSSYAQFQEYAIMELTGKGFLVGDLPAIKQSIGLAENTITDLPQITNKDLEIANDSKKVTAASKVELVATGKAYTRIEERDRLKKEIDNLKIQLDQSRENIQEYQLEIKQAESEVKAAESFYKNNPSRESYATYTSIYNSYQTTYSTANKAISNYNSLVNKYNSLVQKYKNY